MEATGRREYLYYTPRITIAMAFPIIAILLIIGASPDEILHGSNDVNRYVGLLMMIVGTIWWVYALWPGAIYIILSKTSGSFIQDGRIYFSDNNIKNMHDIKQVIKTNLPLSPYRLSVIFGDGTKFEIFSSFKPFGSDLDIEDIFRSK